VFPPSATEEPDEGEVGFPRGPDTFLL